MDPETLLASPETYERIVKICRRRCCDENEALECTTFVMDRLKASRVRAYNGHSSPETYLYVMVNSLVIGFLHHRYGPRPKPASEHHLKAAAVIRETMVEFSEDDQMLVRLVYGSRLSVAAAARALDIRPGAARKRLKRSLICLREKLLAVGTRELRFVRLI